MKASTKSLEAICQYNICERIFLSPKQKHKSLTRSYISCQCLLFQLGNICIKICKAVIWYKFPDERLSVWNCWIGKKIKNYNFNDNFWTGKWKIRQELIMLKLPFNYSFWHWDANMNLKTGRNVNTKVFPDIDTWIQVFLYEKCKNTSYDCRPRVIGLRISHRWMRF